MKDMFLYIRNKLKFELAESGKVCLNEYRNIFRDTGVMLIFFGAFLMYPIWYPYAYKNEVVRDVPVAVVDHDNSEMSRQLIRMIDATELIRIETKPMNLTEAKNDFFKDKVNGVILIPAGFNKNILRGEQACVSAFCDASYFLLYRQVLKGVKLAAGTLSAGIELKRLTAGGMPEKQAMSTIQPMKVISNILFNPSSGYSTYVMPAIFIILLQQTLLIGIGILGGTARENRQYHFFVPEGTKTERVISLVLGKGAAYFSLYISHSVYLFVILFRVFGFAQRGSVFTLSLFLLSYLACVISLGMALSAFFRNRELSIMFVAVTSIPFFLLGGLSWPTESIPSFINYIGFLVPSTVGVEGILRISQMGAPLKDVMDVMVSLWGLTVFYLVFAVLYYRHIVKKFSA